MVGRLIRTLFGALILTSVGAAIAAVVAKRRLASVGTSESDEVALVAIFEPLEFESTAKAFRGGTALCWYGGGDIDLRDATLDPAGADLEFRIVFGGGRLLVPDDWNVDLRVVGVFGGVGDMRETRERPDDAPRLTVRGFAVFGGLSIESSKREAPIPVAAPEVRAIPIHTNGADASASDADTELIPALDV